MCGKRLAPAVFLLGACNALLGLERPGSDFDGDGVEDTRDNCLVDANPQQLDLDRDGVGNVCDCEVRGIDLDADGVDDACDDCIGEPIGEDVGGDQIDDGCEACPGATNVDEDLDGLDDGCDPCLLGPEHDEDRDGIADACDNCPAQPNPDQRAAPGAELGDACAETGLAHDLFDPFVAQDPVGWPGIVDGWSWVDDGVVLGAMTARTFQPVLTAPLVAETGVAAGSEVGLTCLGGASQTTCVTSAVPSLRLSVLDFGTLVEDREVGLPAGTGALRLRLRLRTDEVVCEAVDGQGVALAAVAIPDGQACSRVRLFAPSPSRIEYLWVATP